MKNLLFYFVAFLIASLQVSCWWEQGHILVAQVAKDRLIASGNQHAYDKMQELVKAFVGFTDGKSDTFIEASVWADDIKETGVKIFNEYHFTDIAYDPEYLFKGMTQVQVDVNSVNTMGWAWTVLRTNKEGISFERAFMARYLLHVAGDIHQPLHSVNGFSHLHKTGDLGGNLIKIITTPQTNSTNINLHAYMDSMAGMQSFTERLARPLNQAMIDYIKGIAKSIQASFPVDSFKPQEIETTDFHKWVVQSYERAAKEVYPNVVQGQTITEEFDANMKTLCRQQVALAGYRLAYTIQKIFE